MYNNNQYKMTDSNLCNHRKNCYLNKMSSILFTSSQYAFIWGKSNISRLPTLVVLSTKMLLQMTYYITQRLFLLLVQGQEGNDSVFLCINHFKMFSADSVIIRVRVSPQLYMCIINSFLNSDEKPFGLGL